MVMAQYFCDYSGGIEKRVMSLKVFPILRKISIGKALSIGFPPKKPVFPHKWKA